MEIRLEPLTWDNVSALIAASRASYSDAYPLPANDAEAEWHMARLDHKRRNQFGNEFLAYDDGTAPERFIGGGEVINTRVRCTLGYWIIATLRRQGYGRELARTLETQMVIEFPGVKSIELDIDEHNVGSRKIAASVGYELSSDRGGGGGLVYRKAIG